ncbi:MAG: hypothetical protein JWO06_2747 [Bacteroidota bacterium]|nr:hypothetical protein [Bacteroidota bacterium]
MHMLVGHFYYNGLLFKSLCLEVEEIIVADQLISSLSINFIRAIAQ